MESSCFGEEKSKVNPLKMSYSEQCIAAIARALPYDDDWSHTFNHPDGETLESVTGQDLYIPALCARRIQRQRLVSGFDQGPRAWNKLNASVDAWGIPKRKA